MWKTVNDRFKFSNNLPWKWEKNEINHVISNYHMRLSWMWRVMQIEEEGCYPPRVKTEVNNILRVYSKMFCAFMLFARSVLVWNSAISASDNRERHFRKTLTSTRLWRSVVLVKTRIWVKGCSVSRVHKIWSRPFLFKDFRHSFFSSVVYKQHGGRAWSIPYLEDTIDSMVYCSIFQIW